MPVRRDATTEQYLWKDMATRCEQKKITTHSLSDDVATLFACECVSVSAHFSRGLNEFLSNAPHHQAAFKFMD